MIIEEKNGAFFGKRQNMGDYIDLLSIIATFQRCGMSPCFGVVDDGNGRAWRQGNFTGKNRYSLKSP
jgi:hypothetical protein